MEELVERALSILQMSNVK